MSAEYDIVLESVYFYAQKQKRARRDADAMEGMLVSAVERARLSGFGWDEIGSALGVSRQRAMQRYAHKVKKVDLRMKAVGNVR